MSARGIRSAYRWMACALLVASAGCVHRGASARRPSPPATSLRSGSAVSNAPAAGGDWRPVGAPRAASASPAAPALHAPALQATAPVVVPVPPSTSVATGVVAAVTPEAPETSKAFLLKPADPLVVKLVGILPRDEEHERVIDEEGFIKLPHIGRVKAAGLSPSQLEDEIEREYVVEKKIYRSITVAVITPSRSFFIQGEVRQPGRIQLIGGQVTLLRAIAQAGGYTEFADETDVRVIRNNHTTRYNARELNKNPERDVRIEPGDVINVTRSFY